MAYNYGMDEIIARLLSARAGELFAGQDVILAYLFGSVARDEAGPLSDVDVAVLFAPGLDKYACFQRVLRLMYELSLILERDDVQVVDLGEAPPLLRHRVYYDGQVLYCPDDVVRVRFETTALRDYVDTAPLRRIQAKYLYQRFAEGDDQ